MKFYGYQLKPLDYVLVLLGIGNVGYSAVQWVNYAPLSQFVFQLVIGLCVLVMFWDNVYRNSPRFKGK